MEREKCHLAVVCKESPSHNTVCLYKDTSAVSWVGMGGQRVGMHRHASYSCKSKSVYLSFRCEKLNDNYI